MKGSSLGRYLPQGGYLSTFNTGESVSIFGVLDLALNQYLGSLDGKIDNNLIFGVHK